LLPSFGVGVVEKKKVMAIAFAFFWGGYCKKEEGDDSCHCFFLG